MTRSPLTAALLMLSTLQKGCAEYTYAIDGASVSIGVCSALMMIAR